MKTFGDYRPDKYKIPLFYIIIIGVIVSAYAYFHIKAYNERKIIFNKYETNIHRTKMQNIFYIHSKIDEIIQENDKIINTKYYKHFQKSIYNLTLNDE